MPTSAIDPMSPRSRQLHSVLGTTTDLMTPRNSIRHSGAFIVDRMASRNLGTADRKKAPLSRCVVRPESTNFPTKQSAALTYSGFDQVGRQQLKKHLMTRVVVDPDKLPDVEKLPQVQGTEDLEDDVCESDNELLSRFGIEEYVMEDYTSIPEALSAAPGVRLGFGGAGGAGQQDRLFVAKCDQLLLVGLVNCHGKQSVGMDLARLVASELPRAVFRSSALIRERDATRALSDAFCRLHKLAAENLDVQHTGASVTAILVDPENVWVAHVGDCRAVLGVPDHLPNAEEFHFNPVAVMQDHKLCVKQEFDRIQGCGGELRKMVKDNTYRLFLKDTEAPGLALTRLIGHRTGHLVGVSHFPSVSCVRREDLADGAFLVLGSGGLWSMMSERAIVNWVGRCYDDPTAAAQSLSEQAANRWEDPTHPGKQPLHRAVGDCFSTAVLLLDPPHQARPRTSSRPRTFMTNEHTLQFSRKDFSEVKSLDRVARLRRAQANGRPLTEDTIVSARGALEKDAFHFSRTY